MVHMVRAAATLLIVCFVSTSLYAKQKVRTGAEIYRTDCARCHGPKGEGVADKHDEPLYGDRSVESLARLIARTMPEDSDKKCPPDEAAKVAEYIYDGFYSPAARARNQPPRIQLSRLTVPQYLNAVADLVGSFRPATTLDEGRGLLGEYYNARNFRRQRKAFDRVDRKVTFDFGEVTPDPETLTTNEFAIRWTGSVIADETGDYEFGVRTGNGVRLWINNDSKMLIDGWVSSGGQEREERATVRLLGGRAYPLQLDFFKFKDKTASIVLEWKPPHKAWQSIPDRNLVPVRAPETVVVTTAFPADDASVGYERGTSVSKAWEQATTSAAIEMADKVVERLEALSGVKANADHRDEHLKRFCEQFAERAFRRPVTAEQKRLFIDKQFTGTDDVEGAVKRSILLVLKSPRFLYPDIGGEFPDDYDVASRLSFGLWDSIPDQALRDAAGEGRLRTRDQIAAQAQRLLKDPRARSKVRDFFHHWLEMDEAEDISKDTNAFPGFNETLLADLRTSLDMSIEHVMWSEKSDYRQLLLADYLFLNGPLAEFYGADLPEDSDFQPVKFQPKHRSGIVTHPYLLSVFAYHKSSSPIHRGVFLTRNIVGRALKPPPMAIQFMDGRFDPSLTMREKVTELTRPAACQGCHTVINPLGFSLEHYDGVGQFRTTDNSKPVDATGEYTTTEGKTFRISGARDVAKYAAKSKESHLGFIQQLFHYIVKQPPGAYGPNTLENLRRSFAANDFNIQKLIVEIATISARPNPALSTTTTTEAAGRKKGA